MAKEAKARIRINEYLQRSGWRFFDDESCPANITLETHFRAEDSDQTGGDLGREKE
jgi:type I restriction enzyme, R subunit